MNSKISRREIKYIQRKHLIAKFEKKVRSGMSQLTNLILVKSRGNDATVALEKLNLQ